ncbi:MAG: MATE family efflux transporter [Pseudomonadota bacterium]
MKPKDETNKTDLDVPAPKIEASVSESLHPKPTRDTTNPAITNWQVLAIAVPITLSNATTPLIGFVDTVVIGQLGKAHLIGAVAVSANIFSLLFWAFGFLRMGTTGLTAQAVGANDDLEVTANLLRPLILGGAIGAALITLQWPLSEAAFALVSASDAVTDEARNYFAVRIWSAPAALMNYALLGWFIGQSKAGIAFALQLFLNGINLVLSVVFVLVLEWGVAGVAAGVVVAELAALLVGLCLAMHHLDKANADWRRGSILNAAGFLKVLSVNTDIMIRTLCLLAIFFIMTASAARADETTLAANAVLLAMTAITVYFLDGFAYAAETLVGQSVGAGDRSAFQAAAMKSTIWAGVVSVILTALLLVGGDDVVGFMTTDTAVQSAARTYLPWAALTPVFGVWCFQLDGIFIGATATRAMRNMMILSLGVFLAAWWVLTGIYGNHGLWAALMTSYIARAIFLAACLPEVINHRFPSPLRSSG